MTAPPGFQPTTIGFFATHTGAIAHDGHTAGHNNLDGVTNLTGSAGGIAFSDTHTSASA